MAELDVTKSVASNLTEVKKDYSVPIASTDGALDQKKNIWINERWSQYYGYYKWVAEFHALVDAKAAWTTGKGIIATPQTKLILDGIKGFGYDTFITLMENAVRTYQIGGDAYLEIVRDKGRNLTNLKVLNPEFMRHHFNNEGALTHFEQISVVKGKASTRFELDEVFYLPRNRVADQVHGTSMTEALEWIILAKNEAMVDQKLTFHRFVVPRWIIKLDTGVPAEIDKERKKWDAANEQGENMYIPMGTVEVEQMAISPNSTLNPLSWIESLDAKFYEAANTPKIIVGGTGGFTDAAVKTGYLAFEQNIKAEKLFVEEQIGMQLGLQVEFIFPASLQGGLLSDEAKDGTQAQQLNKPSDVPITQ